MTVHPQHDAVAATVASWYQTAHADQGYEVEDRRFGVYRTNRNAPTWGAVTASLFEPNDVPAFVDDVDGYFGDRDVTIEFTHEPPAKQALIASGWSDFDETVYLAHVGEFPPTPDAVMESVDSSTLEAFARVKLQSFADSDDEPEPSTLTTEVSMRSAELRGDGRGLLATVDGEPASMSAYYSGGDYFVFLLGTRLPFRGRGIASAILRRIVDEARASAARSVVINARAGGRPEALYRGLGFSDEVYRQWRFRRPSTSAGL